MNHVDKLIHAVAPLARRLQQISLKATGQVHTVAHPQDKQTWQFPALTTNLVLLGQPLQELVNLLYGNSVTLDKLTEVWDLVPAVINGSPRAMRPLVKHLASAIPNCPFTPTVRGDTHGMLAQFLTVAALSPHVRGVALIGTREASLRINTKQTLAFTRLGLEGTRGVRRLVPWVEAPFTKALTIPLDKQTKATVQTSGLFRLLTNLLPDLRKELDLLFAIVVCGGRDVQRVFTELFDVEVRPDDEADQSPFALARRVIDFSTTTAQDRLHEILAEVVPKNRLLNAFGRQSQTGSPLTPLMRKRQRRSLDALERDFGTPKRPGVNDLIQLSRQIGGS